MTDPKIFFAAIALVLTVISFGPYIRGIYQGKNRPHIFSWVIWLLVAGVVGVAQVTENAGPAAWVTILVFILCVVTVALSWKSGERSGTKSDWVMFIAGLVSIPLWILTDDPLWSVVIVTLINSSAYYPTLRKSWFTPFEEQIAIYAINIPRHFITIAAIKEYSVVNMLYPVSMILMCVLLCGAVLYRRKTAGNGSV